MKKLVSLLLVASLLLIGTFAATAEEAKKWEGHHIVYASWGDGAEKAARDAAIAAFEEATGCEVTHINNNSDYDTKITAMVAAGEQIDCGMLESATIAYPMAEQGLLEPLDSYVEASGIDMNDYVAASCYYDNDGNLISWSGNIELMCLFYNRDVFDAAGIAYPPSSPEDAWTWDEFVDVAKQLTKDANGLTPNDEGFDPDNIVQYGVNPGVWWPVWGSFILSNGGSIVDENGNFAMNQPEAVEALQAFCDLKLVDHVAPSVAASESLPAGDVALLTGTYAMVIDGQWNALTYSEAGINFGMATLPKYGDKVVSICTNGMNCIFSASQEKEAAWDLIQYLSDPSIDLTLFRNGNLMPTSIEWLTDEDKLAQWVGEDNPARPEGYEGIIDMLINNSAAPLTGQIIGFPDLITLVDAGIEEVLYGNMTAQEAMDSVAAQIEEAGLELGLRTAATEDAAAEEAPAEDAAAEEAPAEDAATEETVTEEAPAEDAAAEEAPAEDAAETAETTEAAE